jgi:hypothetical protein
VCLRARGCSVSAKRQAAAAATPVAALHVMAVQAKKSRKLAFDRARLTSVSPNSLHSCSTTDCSGEDGDGRVGSTEPHCSDDCDDYLGSAGKCAAHDDDGGDGIGHGNDEHDHDYSCGWPDSMQQILIKPKYHGSTHPSFVHLGRGSPAYPRSVPLSGTVYPHPSSAYVQDSSGRGSADADADGDGDGGSGLRGTLPAGRITPRVLSRASSIISIGNIDWQRKAPVARWRASDAARTVAPSNAGVNSDSDQDNQEPRGVADGGLRPSSAGDRVVRTGNKRRADTVDDTGSATDSDSGAVGAPSTRLAPASAGRSRRKRVRGVGEQRRGRPEPAPLPTRSAIAAVLTTTSVDTGLAGRQLVTPLQLSAARVQPPLPPRSHSHGADAPPSPQSLIAGDAPRKPRVLPGVPPTLAAHQSPLTPPLPVVAGAFPAASAPPVVVHNSSSLSSGVGEQAPRAHASSRGNALVASASLPLVSSGAIMPRSTDRAVAAVTGGCQSSPASLSPSPSMAHGGGPQRVRGQWIAPRAGVIDVNGTLGVPSARTPGAAATAPVGGVSGKHGQQVSAPCLLQRLCMCGVVFICSRGNCLPADAVPVVQSQRSRRA